MRRLHLGACGTLTTRGHRVVWAEGNPFLLVKLDGEVLALQGTCSHEQYSLEDGWVIDGTITCPAHLSRFDLRTGEVLDPPAHLPLVRYRVVVEDNEVYVETDGQFQRNE